MFFGGDIIEEPKAFLKMAEQQIKFFLYCLKENVIEEIIRLGKVQQNYTQNTRLEINRAGSRINELEAELVNGFLLQETPNLIQEKRALNQEEREQMVSKVCFHIRTLFEMLGVNMLGSPTEPDDYTKFNRISTLRRFNNLLNSVNYLKAVLN